MYNTVQLSILLATQSESNLQEIVVLQLYRDSFETIQFVFALGLEKNRTQFLNMDGNTENM